MEDRRIEPIQAYFETIKDPRIERKKVYPLINVIVITLLAVMSGAQGWETIEMYGNVKKKWLSKFLDLSAGVPRDDVYRRVINRIKPAEIEESFMRWVRALKKDYSREIIAIDGKTVRGSFNAAKGNKALDVVSAWATENKMVFAQEKTEDHSNEITAIPKLLERLALEGTVVTIDAMGCQYEIADRIVKAKADYVFSLKGNQGTLNEDVEEYFADLDFNKPKKEAKYIKFESVSSHDEGHGRIEDRDYAVSGDVKWLLNGRSQWKTIKTIGMVESTREIKGESRRERWQEGMNRDRALKLYCLRSEGRIKQHLFHIFI
jgi:predicted transposase YbfD/YdcC